MNDDTPEEASRPHEFEAIENEHGVTKYYSSKQIELSPNEQGNMLDVLKLVEPHVIEESNRANGV